MSSGDDYGTHTIDGPVHVGPVGEQRDTTPGHPDHAGDPDPDDQAQLEEMAAAAEANPAGDDAPAPVIETGATTSTTAQGVESTTADPS